MITVLIVDDDPGIRFLLRTILEDEGYRVLEAGNGEAALAAIGSQVPDVVTTDLMMPVSAPSPASARSNPPKPVTMATTAIGGMAAVSIASSPICPVPPPALSDGIPTFAGCGAKPIPRNLQHFQPEFWTTFGRC